MKLTKRFRIIAFRQNLILLVLILMLLCLTACSTGATPAASLDSSPTAAESEPTTTATHTPTATETLTPTSTDTPLPTLTPTSTQTEPPTITPTPLSHRMDALVQRLYDEDVIHSLKGKYTLLEDFEMSWAQLYWYQWYRIGFTPQNFIIRIDATWESASQTANWNDSGCGIVFSEKDADNHHAVFLTMDGYVRTHKFKGGLLYGQQAGYYDRFEIPKDSAELVVVVDNQVLTVLVNGEIVVQYEDAYIQRGHVALSLASGTNKDFGTKCEMRNLDYWSIQ